MATIYNSDLSKELIDGGKLQVNRDIIPNQLADKVVPVMETNPKLLRRTNINKSISWSATGGSTTLIAVPADKVFYITAITYSIIKDAACDQASGSFPITFVCDAFSSTIALFETLTLTAQECRGGHYFNIPIKCDGGSSITTAARAFTAGVFRGRINVHGYFDDIIRA